MVDTVLVQAVLDEEWEVDEHRWLHNGRASVAMFNMRAPIGAAEDYDSAAERARQAALGHRALQWVVAYVDSGQCLDSEGPMIVAELRGGK